VNEFSAKRGKKRVLRIWILGSEIKEEGGRKTVVCGPGRPDRVTDKEYSSYLSAEEKEKEKGL